MFTRNKIESFSDIQSRKVTICAAILFQSVWFACILASALVWLPSVFFFFFIYLYVFRCARYLKFVLVAASLGIAVDYSLFLTGAIRFEDGRFPIWLIALWLVFTSSIPLAFGFLRKRYLLATVLGGFGGASSYYAASRFRGDIIFYFGDGLSLIPLVIIWAILMPLLLYFLEKFVPLSQSENPLISN